MRRVEALLPGVTTVTPHARYYSLHAYIATELSGLETQDARDLLRRCEVVFGAVSILHARQYPEMHFGMSQPHGGDKIEQSMNDNGVLEVVKLAALKEYAQAQDGFLGPYLGSERTMRLVQQGTGLIEPGVRVEPRILVRAFQGLLKIAQMDRVETATLQENNHLCLCGHSATERGWLRSVMIPRDVGAVRTLGMRRTQTAQMLGRLIELFEPESISRDLAGSLVEDPAAYEDLVLLQLDVVPAWRGVVLRRWYTQAWRDFWQWLVNEKLVGARPRSAWEHSLTGGLPANMTLLEYEQKLPLGVVGGALKAAEISDVVRDIECTGARQIAMLIIGARRVGNLPESVAPHFENPEEEILNAQLTPSWLAKFLDERQDKQITEVGRELIALVIDRSQRVALSKGTFKNGIWKIPSRITVSDGLIFKSSNEGGGPVSLRWDQLVQVMSGLGIVSKIQIPGTVSSKWTLTAEGRGYLA